uniref:Phosphatidylinositol transfer protein membrane associated 2 n=1 Tax=Salmo trutta TaxID=8032 RepID=A0A674EAQ9_SALTR
MLIKEYRIPMPMSVDEYRIAQLYMIQKKSRDETCGEGSGVEILENKPYDDGPGGIGQYTHKVYHIGMHIPSWFRSILPKAALRVEEESWNAYPYTRTRYTCPFVEKFSIDIETYYKPDTGNQPDVFNMSPVEKRLRTLDPIDIVKDPIPPHEYMQEEDPRIYRSDKTKRGPLQEDWIEEYNNNPGKTPIMCAYKLCKVEFRYWGMQSKIERFIHDVGLRKVMVRAHRQAWCWQDEWYGLTIEDIRQLELETQLALAQKMAQFSQAEEATEANGAASSPDKNQEAKDTISSLETEEVVSAVGGGDTLQTKRAGLTKQWSTSSRSSRSSKRGGETPSRHSLSEWRMQSIARDSDDSSEEEFFDAHEDLSDDEQIFPKEIAKWNSNDLMDKIEAADAEDIPGMETKAVCCIMGDRRDRGDGVRDLSSQQCLQPSKIHVLILVLHGGNILDTGGGDQTSKQGDINTISTAFDAVMRVHYPTALGRIAIRLVPCPAICAEAFSLVTNLSPYSYDESCLSSSQDHIPLAALPLLATSAPQYQEAVATVIMRANQVYNDFIRSLNGATFSGQVCLIGDCVGGILGFDALCSSNQTIGDSQNSSRRGSVINLVPFACQSSSAYIPQPLPAPHPSLQDQDLLSPGIIINSGHGSASPTLEGSRHLSLSNIDIPHPCSRRSSSSTFQDAGCLGKFDFEVADFFLFGSPLGLVLALRKTVIPVLDVAQLRPACQQVYNLFHPADPSASRLEPLLEKKFHILPPFNVPRYTRFPLGDGNSALLGEHTGMRAGRVHSDTHTHTHASTCMIAARWWGTKRMDFALYCPDALTAFPTVALPHLFHASYWESTDVVSFLLRQVSSTPKHPWPVLLEVSEFTPSKPREKWLRKRTHVKIRNVTANHRVNDAVFTEDGQQIVTGRFMYGPLDMVTLTGEKVDIHIMTQPPSGDWVYFDTELTNSSGRVSFIIPESKRLGVGVYPVKLVVRGDHTFADSYLTVLPRGTEFVVFSIDGSFAASVSIMGSDPKVRAGAVDVVRHWQDLGYLIVYVTGRPDMQKQRVVAWLSQHNFPHGIVSFCDGLVHDPLRHKANFLKSLMEVRMGIFAGYGSTKDISVYTSIGLSPSQIYIIGRPSKKMQAQCQFITEGYATHLSQLEYNQRSRPPKTSSARMVLRKGSFGLGAKSDFLRKRNHLLRTISAQPTTSSSTGSGHSRPERTQSQSDSHSHSQHGPGPAQRSMSMAAGCWGRSGSTKLESGIFNPK